MTLEHEIQFSPAFDKRNPDPKIDFGIYCVEMRWLVKGPGGTVQFAVLTGWNLPSVEFNPTVEKLYPMASDLGYHSLVPHYEGQSRIKECPFVDGKTCYYDGSTLNAKPVLALLIENGHQAVWDYLDEYYDHVFGEKK